MQISSIQPTRPLLFSALNLSDNDVYLAQQQDVRAKALAIRLLYKQKPLSEILRSFVNTWAPACKIDKGLLTDKEGRYYVPASLKNTILKYYHDSLGHKNKFTTHELIAKHWIWPEMKLEIDNYCTSCETCQRVKPPSKYTHQPLRPLDQASYFNERVHIDCLTNLPPSSFNNLTCALVLVDAFSGYTLAFPIKSPNSHDVQTVLLNNWISMFSTPKTLVSDGGREFVNKTIAETAKLLNIEHRVTSPGHSRSNGLAERKIRQLNEFLRCYVNPDSQHSWSELLPSFSLATNTVKSSSRGFSPHFLVFHQEPQLAITNLLKFKSYNEESWVDKLRSLARVTKTVFQNQEANFSKNKLQHDKKAQGLHLEPGDKIYIRNSSYRKKLDDKFSGPFLVLEDINDHVKYKIPYSAKVKKVHKDLVRIGEVRDQFSDIPNAFADLNDVQIGKAVLKAKRRRSPRIQVSQIFSSDEEEAAEAPGEAVGENQGQDGPPVLLPHPQEGPQPEQQFGGPGIGLAEPVRAEPQPEDGQEEAQPPPDAAEQPHPAQEDQDRAPPPPGPRPTSPVRQPRANIRQHGPSPPPKPPPPPAPLPSCQAPGRSQPSVRGNRPPARPAPSTRGRGTHQRAGNLGAIPKTKTNRPEASTVPSKEKPTPPTTTSLPQTQAQTKPRPSTGPPSTTSTSTASSSTQETPTFLETVREMSPFKKKPSSADKSHKPNVPLSDRLTRLKANLLNVDIPEEELVPAHPPEYKKKSAKAQDAKQATAKTSSRSQKK